MPFECDFTSGDNCNVIYCEYTEDWKGSHPKKVLEVLDCEIQGDGYAGISSLFAREGGPRRVGCNDHCRRKLCIVPMLADG